PNTNLEELEHPMALNMAPEFEKQLQSDPQLANSKNSEGWTNLHTFALAGSPCCVNVLLKHGADPNAKTNHGMTPLQLARSLNWTPVANLLLTHGATE
ncbi:MAG: ankyrin repeat domain-containing protein, partial [Planctomycetaceae bacterium]|nr:ankyrin repeat domain-containing protein [Planctomycetaceae bacterium]